LRFLVKNEEICDFVQPQKLKTLERVPSGLQSESPLKETRNRNRGKP